MNKDQAKEANQLWEQHGPVLNEIIQQDLSPYDLICARLWPRCDEIAKVASTENVRLHFIDNGRFEVPDQAEIDFQIGVMIRSGDTDAFEITPLPILMNIEINHFVDLSIDIQLKIPDERSVYHVPFKEALIPLRHRFKDSDPDWMFDITLRTIEADDKSDPFTIDDLIDQLPGVLLDINKAILQPLASTLQEQDAPSIINANPGATSND